jgi:superfamily II DNA/RNA helicase
MNHEENNLNPASLDDSKVDAHSASQIDALARRLSSESDNDFEVATESAEVAVASGPTFADLGLDPLLIKALNDSGYTSPTSVQVRAIPAAMNGADLRVASNTGSGKTAAFMLPALERIVAARGDNAKRREKGKVFGPRVLVLAPTRELALQVAKAADTYGRHLQGLRVATIVGGVPYAAQLKALRGPLDVLIATPGRLLDHLGSGAAVLSNLEVLVLDEADRMLDMGFIEDIEAIADQTPENRQTLMFSATFAGHVGKLAERLTRNAQHIEVASHTDSHDNIEQRLHLADTLAHKNELLDHLLTTKEVDQAVVFTSTQRDADILADRLADMGHAVAALHGGMPQGRRNRVLQGLRHGELRVLVATDVAARGIDVPTITHVINYGMPMKPEDYVHRIGRTGRAGRSGLAVTLAERRDIPMVRRIERFTTQRIPECVIVGLEPKMKSGSGSERPAGRGGKPMGGGFRGGRPEGRFGGDRGGFGGGDRDRGNFGGGDRGGDRGGYGAPRSEGFGGGDRGSFGAPRNEGFKPYGDRPSGDRPAFGGKPAGGKPFGAKPGFGGGDRPSYGDRPSFGDRAERGDRPSYGDRPAFGDRPSGDRPAFGGKPGGNKPFGAKPGFKAGGPKPGFGGKRPGFAKREG